jgi:hypothetical protein
MNNKYITGIIGVGAFVIGGLLARQTAIEGIELLDETVKNRFHKNDPPADAAE